MLRCIAMVILLAATTVAPSVATACATSCAMGGMAIGMAGTSQPCHGDESNNEPPGDESGAMTAMCAVAASAAITVSSSYTAAIYSKQDSQPVETSPTSFFTLPADEPPIA